MQLTTLVLAALSSLAYAQQKTWVVAVAQNGSLTYSPDKLRPQPGEFVQFQFHAGNHTVTQSTFDKPCLPISMNSNATGFHSGFLPAAASASMGMFPTYTIQINNTNPLWIYCAQGKHCQNGMVMVINEPANNPARTLENYKKAAAQVAQAVAPGGGAAGAGGQTGSTPTSTGTGTGSGSAPSPTQTAGAGMLTIPGTVALIAAAGAAMLL